MKKHNIPKSNSNTISKKKTPTTPPHEDPFYPIKTITNLMTYETKYIQ